MRYTLTLTDKCNKNCSYCYENNVRKNRSLSTTNLYKQLSNIIKEGNAVKQISFFGGEPFLELDLMKRTYYIIKKYNLEHSNKINLSFITNGILLESKEVIDFLSLCQNNDMNPFIIISFDGYKNTIINLEKNIKKLVNLLNENNVRINYTISSNNIKDIFINYKIAENLNVKKIHYRPVHEDFVKNSELMQIYKEQMIKLFNYLKFNKLPLELFPFIPAYQIWDLNKVDSYNYIYQQRQHVGCNMDFSHLTYSMDDELYYCHRLQFYQAFIKDVKEANQYMKDHNGTFTYDGCDTCPTLKQCGMCSIINEIYTGDKNTPHPTLCQFQIVVHELTEIFFKMFHPTFQEGYVNP